MESTTSRPDASTEQELEGHGNRRADIDTFLKLQRFAMVGVSRKEKEFSRSLFRDLRGQGYDVLPVNPAAMELDGVKCESSVRRLSPSVKGALLMVPASRLMEALQACADAGIFMVWIYGVSGPGKHHRDAIRFCRENGITLIAGYCPYMFLPKSAFFHRFHGTINRIIGRIPR